MCQQITLLGRVADLLTKLPLPYFDNPVPAGFPNPGGDYEQDEIDLNKEIIRDKECTFFVEVGGDSMINANIPHKSILVVDRSLLPKSGCVIVASTTDGYTVKFYIVQDGKIYLRAANPKYKDIKINESHNFTVWGVVTRILVKPPNFFE